MFNQTYPDYEVLVTNDGSTDCTATEVRKYGVKVQLLSQGNMGPASARNLGIKSAKGEYIAFLDADDLWLPDKLKTQVAFMDVHPDVGFSYTHVQCFSIDTNEQKIKRRELICNLEGNVFKDLFWSDFIVNSSVMVRKSCLEKVGLLDESHKLIGSEDYDLWLRLSREYNLGCIHDILLEYRLRQNSLIGGSYEKAFPMHVYIYNKFYHIFTNTPALYGISKNQALVDLFLRYGFKNLIDKNYNGALTKSIVAMKYAPVKAFIASMLCLLKNNDYHIWNKLIPKLDLWSRICGAQW